MEKKHNRTIFSLESYLFFLIIYAPRISDIYLGIRVELIVILTLLIMLIPWIKSRRPNFYFNKKIFIWAISIILSSLYFSFRALSSGESLRYVQNLYIIVQVLYVYIANDYLNKKRYGVEEKFELIIKLAAFQGVVALVMIVFPSLKNIALDLYYLDKVENIFISRMRIYGISGEYTFFTPIYHGIVASISIYFGVEISKKYFFYFPFILLIIVMNGRTGLIPIFVSIMLIFFRNKVDRKRSTSVITAFILFLSIFLIINFIRYISPYTYEWINFAIIDIKNLIFRRELTGTLKILFDDFVFFPDSKGIIFGNGYRVYAGNALKYGYGSSDMGYINDIFMGGIIYVSILYYANFKYVLSYSSNSESKTEKNFIKYIKVLMIIVLILANFKGEVMRSGLLVLSAIMFGLFF